MNKAQAPERLFMAIVVRASDERSTQWVSNFISWHRTLLGGCSHTQNPTTLWQYGGMAWRLNPPNKSRNTEFILQINAASGQVPRPLL